uniref:Peptidase S1 domain-containing protein n=1 Tax=Photinus pyralis TaxID=7054 RepID=A0A1Y1MV00_PHOPY
MSLKFDLFLFVTSCLFFQASPQRNLNTDCTVRGSNAFGVCRLITDCPRVQDAANRATATICGFQGRTPIVCCEEKKKVLVNDNTFLDIDNKNGDEGFIFPENNEYIWSQSNGVESIAEEKCREYSKSVMGVVNAVPLITDAEPVSIDVVNCDNYGLPLIVGGSPAAPGEFPFMAVLGYSTNDGIGWFCGGTLVSNNYVITAAHCASTIYGEPVIVRLGEIDLKSDNDGTEYKDYNVVSVKAHEQYRPPSHNHDIALIKLSKKSNFYQIHKTSLPLE